MRFKKSPQLPGAGRTRAWYHHGSHTPTSPWAILLSKMACQPKHIGRQCKSLDNFCKHYATQRVERHILFFKEMSSDASKMCWENLLAGKKKLWQNARKEE